MKKIVLILITSLIFSSIGCKRPAEKEGEKISTSVEKGNQPNEALVEVKLNNGQKWIADYETTRSIAVMQGLLREFPTNATLEDYSVLHKKLVTRYQSILQKCTMAGDPIAQLNVYLKPLKKLIDTIGTGSLESCNQTLPEMQAYLMKYSHFFL